MSQKMECTFIFPSGNEGTIGIRLAQVREESADISDLSSILFVCL